MQEDVEEDGNPLRVAQSQSGEVTDEPHGNELPFDYLDMIGSLQQSLDIPTITKLCEHFNMTSSLEKIRASDKPQHHFLLECRRKCIITRKDTTKLLEAFRETGLSNLQRIIEGYNQISNYPDVHVTVNNDNPTSAFSNFKKFMLSKKRAIHSVFTRDKGIYFVDCQEGSLVIHLKVSSMETLDKLKENIESGEFLRRITVMYESEISDTKDFQSESSSMKISYDTEEFENAKQQLTTNNASTRRSIAITKSVTETRTETTILQEEMKEVFHPPSVGQSLSDGGCSVTSEETQTQTRIGTTTSQDGREENVDALGVVPSLSEKDDGDHGEDFLEYLDEVGLKEYFPRKLTMKKATEVRLFPSDDSQIKTRDLPFLFISKLTSLDCRVTWKENLHIEGSVRDFIYAILLCSDNHLRQHLLEKFASCQLAVPVLLPGVKDDAKPELLTWALSRVVKKWKENETSLAPEKRMVSEPVFTTAFIRFGDIPISKSSVLNSVIGRAQGNETFRYFLSYEEEREYVYHCCGSVEAQWYLPMYGRKEELLREVTLLLNLRGDSKEFTAESEFMCRVANAIFLFVDKHKLECYKTAINGIQKKFKNVFVIHLIVHKGNDGRQRRRQQSNRKRKTLKIDENEDSVDFGVERNGTDLAKIICVKILQYCNDTSREDYRSIEDWPKFCSDDVTVDQDNDSYKIAKLLLQSSFPTHESIENMKKSYLQLQIEWGKWVEADKKPLCFGEQTVTNQYEAKQRIKHDLRQKQRQKGLSAKMEVFWVNLQTVMFDKNDLLHYFMSIFQTHLEMMAAREIPPLVNRIDVLKTSLQERRSTMKQAWPSERSKVQNEIKELQKQLLNDSQQVNAKHITCEHFIRELGQWYEANLGDKNFRERNELLVKIASNLLLAGYPLELFDGENAYIPMKWISGVLKNLENRLNNPRIFVLSIIGIQSSGKSTLLNSMFGVRFPVRAGRCTRGLYFQLLEVNEEFREQLGFQYLLIIDTEGLHSPDRTVLNDHTIDNSIATLAMCIGGLTLLNIGQETIGPDMIGILQIVVHALIRMKKVELVSNCRIIQQRVSDIAAVANNKTNMAKIKDALNKATRIAAAEEKVDHIQDFSDVFPLAEDNDLQFFPCLWMGLMSPPNPGYSDKIQALKDAIFKTKVNQLVNPPQFTMAMFVQRLTNVWNAVKSEDFVFNFQNSFDALSNHRFRLEHSKLIGKMRTEIFQWELNNGSKITNATKEHFYRKLEIEIIDKCEAINKKIDEYVKEHSDEEEVIRCQKSIKNETFGIGKDIERSIRENTEIQLQKGADIEGLPNFIREAKEELKCEAKKTAKQLKDKQTLSCWKENLEELDIQFDILWDKKIKQLERNLNKFIITEKYIEQACDNSLRKLMLGTEYSKAYTDVMIKRGDLMGKGKYFAHWLGRNFGGFNDVQDKVQIVVFGILNRHRSDLRNHAKVIPFRESRVDTILLEVYNVLTDIKVKSETLVSTLREVQNEVCTVCKDCQRQYESHNSLHRMFQNEKDCLKDEFKGYVDETIKSGVAVKRSYSECVTVFKKYTLNAFNVKLLVHMRNEDCYNDKQKILGRILEELCLKEDPTLYHDFIQDNDAFVSNWLSQKVLTEITTRSKYWVRDVIDKKINEILGYVQSALRKTQNELTAPGGEQTTTFREWANTFLKSEYMTEYGMDIKFSVENFKLSDIAEFTKVLDSMFNSQLKRDITKGWDLDKLSDPSVACKLYSKMRDVARDILDHLGTCKEVCPFCKVPCLLQIRGEHKHKAMFHYPLGLAGYRDNASKKLYSSPCTMLVASDTRYRCRIGPPEEYRPYKEYTKDYPSWDIIPITGDTPITYWKWALQTFNNDFAKFYNANPAELPLEWGTVSNEDALKSLRENYHVNNN